MIARSFVDRRERVHRCLHRNYTPCRSYHFPIVHGPYPTGFPMINFDTAQVLADPTARAAFKHIAKARHIRLGDLTERIHESQGTIEQHLQELEREGLVAHKRSALPSLRTYYITSDGLRAKREAGIH